MARILIIGGGFAGMAAARALKALARTGNHHLLLIDRRATSVMIPALPDYAAQRIDGSALQAAIANRLPKGIEFRQTDVMSLDPISRTVQTTAEPIGYDYLILAAGSRSRTVPPSWPKDSGYPLCAIEEAESIRQAIPRHVRQRKAPVFLFHGGGYTALELATAIAVQAHAQRVNGRICILERGPQVMPFLNHAERQRVLRCLKRLRIELRTDDTITQYDGNHAILASGAVLDHPMLFRADGTRSAVPPPQGFPALADGRLRVCPDLSLPDHPECFVAGDAAAIDYRGEPLRKAVNFACFSGARAGGNIVRTLSGKSTRVFVPLDAGWVVPLAEDSVGRAFDRIPLRGAVGLRLHYLMCGLRNFNRHHFRHFLAIACRRNIRSLNG